MLIVRTGTLRATHVGGVGHLGLLTSVGSGTSRRVSGGALMAITVCSSNDSMPRMS